MTLASHIVSYPDSLPHSFWRRWLPGFKWNRNGINNSVKAGRSDFEAVYSWCLKHPATHPSRKQIILYFLERLSHFPSNHYVLQLCFCFLKISMGECSHFESFVWITQAVAEKTRRALGRAHTPTMQCLIHEDISGPIHFWNIMLHVVFGPISQWWKITLKVK